MGFLDESGIFVDLGIDPTQYNRGIQSAADTTLKLISALERTDRAMSQHARQAEIAAQAEARLAKVVEQSKHQFDGFAGVLQQRSTEFLNFVASSDRAAFAVATFSAVSAAALGGLVKVIASVGTQSALAEAHLQSLSIVVQNFGKDAEKAQRAAQGLASDGLLTLGEASSALKNILQNDSVTIEQATELINRLKDAASANPRAGMSLADQILKTTEGIKLGLSSLTDNSGISTNLSTFYERWAALNDMSAAKMNENQKQLAAVTEMTKEALVFDGMAAKRKESLLGAQDRLNNSVALFNQSVGKVYEELLKNIVNGLASVVRGITTLVEENPRLTLMATALAGMATAVGALAGAINFFGVFAAGALQGLANVVNLASNGWARLTGAVRQTTAAEVEATAARRLGKAAMEEMNLKNHQAALVEGDLNLALKRNEVQQKLNAIATRERARAQQEASIAEQLSTGQIDANSAALMRNRLALQAEQDILQKNLAVYQMKQLQDGQAYNMAQRNIIARELERRAMERHNVALSEAVALKGMTMRTAEAEIVRLRQEELQRSAVQRAIRATAAAQWELHSAEMTNAEKQAQYATWRAQKVAALEREFIATGRVAEATARAAIVMNASNARVVQGFGATVTAANGLAAAFVRLRVAAAGFFSFLMGPWGMALTLLATLAIPAAIDAVGRLGKAHEEAAKQAQEAAKAEEEKRTILVKQIEALQDAQRKEEELTKARSRAEKGTDDLARIEAELAATRESIRLLNMAIVKQNPSLLGSIESETSKWVDMAKALEWVNREKATLAASEKDKQSGGKAAEDIANAARKLNEAQAELSKLEADLASLQKYNSASPRVIALREEAVKKKREEVELARIEYEIKRRNAIASAKDAKTTQEQVARTADTYREAMEAFDLDQKKKRNAGETEVKQAEDRLAKLKQLHEEYRSERIKDKDLDRKMTEAVVDAEWAAIKAREGAQKTATAAEKKRQADADAARKKADKDRADALVRETKLLNDKNAKLNNTQQRDALVGMLGKRGITGTRNPNKGGQIEFDQKKLQEQYKDQPALRMAMESVIKQIQDFDKKIQNALSTANIKAGKELRQKAEEVLAKDLIKPLSEQLTNREKIQVLYEAKSKFWQMIAQPDPKTGKATREYTDKEYAILQKFADDITDLEIETAMEQKQIREQSRQDELDQTMTTTDAIEEREKELRERLRINGIEGAEADKILHQQRVKAYSDLYIKPVVGLGINAIGILLSSHKTFGDKVAEIWGSIGNVATESLAKVASEKAFVAIGNNLEAIGTLAMNFGTLVMVAIEGFLSMVPGFAAAAKVMGIALYEALGPIGIAILGIVIALTALGAVVAWVASLFSKPANEAERFNKEVKDGTLEAAQLMYDKAVWLADQRKKIGIISNLEHKRLLTEAVADEVEALQKVLDNTKLSNKERAEAAELLKLKLTSLHVARMNEIDAEFQHARMTSNKLLELGAISAREHADRMKEAAEERYDSLEKQYEDQLKFGNDVTTLMKLMADQRKVIVAAELSSIRQQYEDTAKVINKKFGLGVSTALDAASAQVQALEQQLEDSIDAILTSGNWDKTVEEKFNSAVQALAGVRKAQADMAFQYEMNVLNLRYRFNMQTEEEITQGYINALNQRREALAEQLVGGNLTDDLKKEIETAITDINNELTQATLSSTFANAKRAVEEAQQVFNDGLMDAGEFRNVQNQQLRAVYDRLNSELRAFKGTEEQKGAIEAKRLDVLAALQDEKRRQDLLSEKKHQTELDRLRNAQLRQVTDYFKNQETSLNSKRALGRISEGDYQTQMQELKVQQAQSLQFILDNANLAFDEMVAIEAQLAEVFNEFERLKTDTVEKEADLRAEEIESTHNMSMLRLRQQLAANRITQQEYDRLEADLAIKYENAMAILNRQTRTTTDAIRTDFSSTLWSLSDTTRASLTQMIDSWGVLQTGTTEANTETYDDLLTKLNALSGNATAQIDAMLAEWVRLQGGSSAEAEALTTDWNNALDAIDAHSEVKLQEFIEKWVQTGQAGKDASLDAYNAWISTMDELSAPDKQHLQGLVEKFIGAQGVDQAAADAARDAFNAFIGQDGALTALAAQADGELAPLLTLFNGDGLATVNGAALEGAKNAWNAFLGSGEGQGWLARLPEDARAELQPLLDYFNSNGQVDAATKAAALNAYNAFNNPNHEYSFHKLSSGAIDALQPMLNFFNAESGPLVIASKNSAQEVYDAWNETLKGIEDFAGEKLGSVKDKFEALLGADNMKKIQSQWGNPFEKPMGDWLGAIDQKAGSYGASISSSMHKALSGLTSGLSENVHEQLFGKTVVNADGSTTRQAGLMEKLQSQIDIAKGTIAEAQATVNGQGQQAAKPASPSHIAFRTWDGGQATTTINLNEDDQTSVARWIRDAYTYASSDKNTPWRSLENLEMLNRIGTELMKYTHTENGQVFAELAGKARNQYSSILGIQTKLHGRLWEGYDTVKNHLPKLGASGTYDKMSLGPAFETGGLIPDAPKYDGFSATLHKGEMILPRHITQPLVDLIEGGGIQGGGVSISFGDVHVRNDQDIKKIADEVEKRWMRNLRMQQKF